MPTIRQKKAAKLLIKNLEAAEPLTAGEIVANSGYGVSMKKNPQVVLQSEGVQQELRETYGFDPEIAKKVVGQILETGENDNVKLKAAEMVFKVYGTFAAEKHVNVNIAQEPTERIKELAARLRELPPL